MCSNNKDTRYKYLHLLQDSSFTDCFIKKINKRYNAEDHLFCVISKTLELRHVQYSVNLKIIKYDLSFEKLVGNVELKKYIKRAKKIYIHYLDVQTAYYLLRYMCKGTKLYWMTWGADIYRARRYDLLYDDETKKILSQIRNKKIVFFKNLLVDFIKAFLIKKVDVICTPFKGDYDIIKQQWNTNATHELFSYIIPTQEETIIMDREQPDWLINAKKNYKYILLLGNSADPTNNHISILQKLHAFARKDFFIVVPLSYGNQKYAKIVDDIGRQLFGERYYSIFYYLDTDQYRVLLSNIDVAIFNHDRQQAGGNIETLLSMRKKIYMKKTSLYQFYTERKIKINLIDSLNERTIFEHVKDITIDMQNRGIGSYSNKKYYDCIFR